MVQGSHSSGAACSLAVAAALLQLNNHNPFAALQLLLLALRHAVLLLQSAAGQPEETAAAAAARSRTAAAAAAAAGTAAAGGRSAAAGLYAGGSAAASQRAAAAGAAAAGWGSPSTAAAPAAARSRWPLLQRDQPQWPLLLSLYAVATVSLHLAMLFHSHPQLVGHLAADPTALLRALRTAIHCTQHELARRPQLQLQPRAPRQQQQQLLLLQQLLLQQEQEQLPSESELMQQLQEELHRFGRFREMLPQRTEEPGTPNEAREARAAATVLAALAPPPHTDTAGAPSRGNSSNTNSSSSSFSSSDSGGFVWHPPKPAEIDAAAALVAGTAAADAAAATAAAGLMLTAADRAEPLLLRGSTWCFGGPQDLRATSAHYQQHQQRPPDSSSLSFPVWREAAAAKEGRETEEIDAGDCRFELPHADPCVVQQRLLRCRIPPLAAPATAAAAAAATAAEAVTCFFEVADACARLMLLMSSLIAGFHSSSSSSNSSGNSSAEQIPGDPLREAHTGQQERHRLAAGLRNKVLLMRCYMLVGKWCGAQQQLPAAAEQQLRPLLLQLFRQAISALGWPWGCCARSIPTGGCRYGGSSNVKDDCRCTGCKTGKGLMVLLRERDLLGDATEAGFDGDAAAAALLLLLQASSSCPRLLPAGALHAALRLYAPMHYVSSFWSSRKAARAAVLCCSSSSSSRAPGDRRKGLAVTSSRREVYRHLLGLHKAAADGEAALTQMAAAAAVSECHGSIVSTGHCGALQLVGAAPAAAPCAARALLAQESAVLAAAAELQLPLHHMQHLLRCCCCSSWPPQQPPALAVAAAGADAPGCSCCSQGAGQREALLLLRVDLQLEALASMGASSSSSSSSGLELLLQLQRKAAAAVVHQESVLYLHLQLRIAIVQLLLRRISHVLHLLPLLQMMLEHHHLAQRWPPQMVAEVSYLKAMCCCHLASLLLQEQESAGGASAAGPCTAAAAKATEPRQIQLQKPPDIVGLSPAWRPRRGPPIAAADDHTSGASTISSLPWEDAVSGVPPTAAETARPVPAGELLLHAAAAHAANAHNVWSTSDQAVGLRRGRFQRRRYRDMLLASLTSSALRLQQAVADAGSAADGQPAAAEQQHHREVLQEQFLGLRAAFLAAQTCEQQQQGSAPGCIHLQRQCCCSSSEAAPDNSNELPSWQQRDSRCKRRRGTAVADSEMG